MTEIDHQPKFVIVIPVFNGRKALLILLDRLRKVTYLPILVMDDGSTDGLAISDSNNILYLKHDVNRGKGAALKSAFDYAKLKGYSHAITLDADGQHPPEFIKYFMRHALNDSQALVIGARNLTAENMPFHRKLSNNITSMIISLATGQMMRDVQVGYRCYPLCDSRLWRSIEDGFQFETDVLLNAKKLKISLIWQRIPVIYSDESSHISLVLDTLRFVRMFFRNFKC